MARDNPDDDKRRRSRSPRRKEHNSHKRKRTPPPVRTKPLPFSARLLDKHDYKEYKNVFASYLDIQKQINVNELPESEVKGRFKSFIGKWNRGELAEGWYDPARLTKEPVVYEEPVKKHEAKEKKPPPKTDFSPEQASDSDDNYGPAPALPNSTTNRAGPSIPNLNDLALLRENEAESRDSAYALAKVARKHEAKLSQQRAEELVPRAEPGTRERQLEKKRDLAASNRAFADAKAGGAGGSGIAEVRESDLMGAGDDDSLEGIKARKKEEERKMSERELKREEFARARREEIEERKRTFVQKEEERMQRFLRIAEERFGGSS